MNFKDDYHLKNIVESAPLGIAILDAATFTVELLNDKFLEIAGKPREAILGKWYWEPFAEARAYYEDAMNAVVTSGDSYYADEVKLMLIRHGKEDWLYVTFVYAPVKNDEGKVTKLAVWVLENTKQVKEREAIGASESRLRALVTASSDVIYSMSADWEVMQALVGRGFLANTDEPTTAWRKQNLYPEDLPAISEKISEAIKHKAIFGMEHRVIRADGSPGWTASRAVPILDDTGEIIEWFGTATDITIRVEADRAMKKLNEELAGSNQTLNIALDAGNFATTEVDLATGSMVYNERLNQLFGRSKDDVMVYSDLYDAMLLKYREEVHNKTKKAQDEHSQYDATYEIRWPDGSLHWIEVHCQARYDAAGNPDRMSGILLDVTEQKQDEQRKNDFIDMVSHELKTPLTSLLGYVQIITQKQEDKKLNDVLEKSKGQVKKMNSMITGFLDVSRFQSGKIHLQKQDFSLNELMHDVIAETLLLSSSHEIIFESSVEVSLHADREKIGQVLSNLLSNAIKYSPKGKRILVNADIVDNQAQVRVSDEGMGISQANKAKLFDRFFQVEGNKRKRSAVLASVFT